MFLAVMALAFSLFGQPDPPTGASKSDKAEEMVKAAKQSKAIFEKHGAEFLRMSLFHTGISELWVFSLHY